MSSYPEPTPNWAIDAAIGVTEIFNGQLSAALCQVQIPRISNVLADWLVHAGEAIAAENAKSTDNGRRLVAGFASRVPQRSRGAQYIINCSLSGMPSELTERGRLHDLTLVPVYEGASAQWIAENLVFETGRPVLLLPEEGAAGHRFDKIVVGWDGGRAAARALADALPWLARARSVDVVVITGEKPVQAQQHLAELKRHLGLHEADVECVEAPADGCDAGSALLRYCSEFGAELLVMGAYGHSRVREFLLGGATRTVLSKPSLPILLSH